MRTRNMTEEEKEKLLRRTPRSEREEYKLAQRMSYLHMQVQKKSRLDSRRRNRLLKT